MEEIFDMKDLNRLFNCSKPMHDDFVTSITRNDGELTVEYGRIGDWAKYYGDDCYGSYKKATVTYTLENDTDICLDVYKVTARGLKDVPLKLEELNSWNMIMYKYSVDIWGEMTLYINMNKGKRGLNAELSFTPKSVRYLWE